MHAHTEPHTHQLQILECVTSQGPTLTFLPQPTSNFPSCPMDLLRAKDIEPDRTESTLQGRLPSRLPTPFFPDPQNPPGQRVLTPSRAPGLFRSQTRLPSRASAPPSHPSSVTSRVAVTSRRGGGSLCTSAWRAKGLAEPGGGGCRLGRHPHPGPGAQSQSGLENQFWPCPQLEGGGRSRGHSTLLADPGWTPEAPGLCCKGFRCPGQRRAAWRGHPLLMRSERLGLPRSLFTRWGPWLWSLPTWSSGLLPQFPQAPLAAPWHSHPFAVPSRSCLCPFYVSSPFLLPCSLLTLLCNPVTLVPSPYPCTADLRSSRCPGM